MIVSISAWQMRNSQGSNQFGIKTDGLTDALDAQGQPGTLQAGSVRRLTPRECERLQGFPDDWTRVTWRGKPAADSLRYAACGDAVTVPVAEWIGRRLMGAL